MAGRIARGWELTKASFGVLKKDKELVLLPVLSGIVLVLVGATYFGGFYAALGGAEGVSQELGLLILFVFYVISYFIIIFFHAAVVGAATIRFEGGDPTVRDGLRVASGRLGRIFAWALVAATVGLLLQVASRSRNQFGRILGRIAGVAWSIATYFVVPVILYENAGPIQALQRSAQTVKRTWGEALTGELGTGLIFFLLGLLGLLPLFIGVTSGLPAVMVAGVAVAVLYWLLLGAVGSAVSGILIAGLYKFAKDGRVPSGLPADLVQHPFAGTTRPY